MLDSSRKRVFELHTQLCDSSNARMRVTKSDGVGKRNEYEEKCSLKCTWRCCKIFTAARSLFFLFFFSFNSTNKRFNWRQFGEIKCHDGAGKILTWSQALINWISNTLHIMEHRADLFILHTKAGWTRKICSQTTEGRRDFFFFSIEPHWQHRYDEIRWKLATLGRTMMDPFAVHPLLCFAWYPSFSWVERSIFTQTFFSRNTFRVT